VVAVSLTSRFKNVINQAGGMTQVAEFLPSKHEVLSSNHSPQKVPQMSGFYYF
jgi:hypothetical protein